MNKLFLYTLLTVLTSIPAVRAQDQVPRYELGAQFSVLHRNRPTSQFDFFIADRTINEYGAGGRFTYNLTNALALEAEGNFFPGRSEFPEVSQGHIFQAQFGIKGGKRFKKLGIFGKARPGFVTFTKVSKLTGFRRELLIIPFHGVFPIEVPEFRIGKASYLSADLGGVVEFYPSRRVVARFDIGDTIIRYGATEEFAPSVCPLSAPVCPIGMFTRPEETRHSLQISAGVSFRF